MGRNKKWASRVIRWVPETPLVKKSFDRVRRKNCPELRMFKKGRYFCNMSTHLDDNIRQTVNVATRLVYIQDRQKHRKEAAAEFKYYKQLM